MWKYRNTRTGFQAPVVFHQTRICFGYGFGPVPVRVRVSRVRVRVGPRGPVPDPCATLYSVHIATSGRRSFLIELDDASHLRHTHKYILELLLNVSKLMGFEQQSTHNYTDNNIDWALQFHRIFIRQHREHKEGKVTPVWEIPSYYKYAGFMPWNESCRQRDLQASRVQNREYLVIKW